jgi:hypothetical protein
MGPITPITLLAPIVPIVLFALGVAGCASTGAPGSRVEGNFIAHAPATLNETLAADTVQRLVALYPPARTRFDLAQPAADAFGGALLDALRARGYAVMETPPAAKGAPGTEPAQSDAKPGAASGTPPGLALHYVLDAPAGLSLYRLTVTVGSTSLSRAYQAQNNTVAPAGAWARRE